MKIGNCKLEYGQYTLYTSLKNKINQNNVLQNAP